MNREDVDEDEDAEEDDRCLPQQVPSSNLNEELASRKPETSHNHKYNHHRKHENRVEEAVAMEEGAPFVETDKIKGAGPQNLVADEGISIEFPDISCGQCMVSTLRGSSKQEQKNQQKSQFPFCHTSLNRSSKSPHKEEEQPHYTNTEMPARR